MHKLKTESGLDHVISNRNTTSRQVQPLDLTAIARSPSSPTLTFASLLSISTPTSGSFVSCRAWSFVTAWRAVSLATLFHDPVPITCLVKDVLHNGYRHVSLLWHQYRRGDMGHSRTLQMQVGKVHPVTQSVL